MNVISEKSDRLLREQDCLPVSEVLETRQARPEERFQLLPVITRHRKVKLEIVLDLLENVSNNSWIVSPCKTRWASRCSCATTHQLGHAFIRLLLIAHIHTEMLQVSRQLRVHLRVIARVTIDICPRPDLQISKPVL